MIYRKYFTEPCPGVGLRPWQPLLEIGFVYCPVCKCATFERNDGSVRYHGRRLDRYDHECSSESLIETTTERKERMIERATHA